MTYGRQAGALAAVVLALMALAARGSPVPAGGLENTAHDFTGNAHLTGGRGSIGLCVFCHTPHRGKSTQLLWNHTLSTTAFDYGVPATTAGTSYAKIKGDTYRGPSAKCLSCHDGSVAIGAVGLFKQSAGVLLTDKIGTSGPSATDQIGAGGNMAGNHPVAMPYPYGKTANTYNGITNGPQLVASGWVADPTTNNIRLYSDDGAGNIVGNPKAGSTGIECSSCHDPHNKASKDLYFLRGTLAGNTQASGYLCLQCHLKN